MEACFRPFNVASANSSSPLHVIIKVASNCKHLPKTISADNKSFFLVEDLTPATHKMMVAISKARDTEKTWNINWNIKFTLTGGPTVYTVKSVYDPLAKVLSR